MRNNRVVLITSYCDTQNKIDVLIKNITKIKEFNLDVFLITPINLPQEVISICDLYIKTTENPVTKWPDKCMFDKLSFSVGDKSFELNVSKPDYGWASLYQLKKISQISLTYSYEYFFHILYDTKLTDSLLTHFNTNENCILFPTNKGFDVGGYFIGFNRQSFTLFESMILSDYYYNNYDVAETILSKITSLLPCKKCSEVTEDEVYYFDGLNLFNYTDFNEFKVFIHKRTGIDDNVKLFFYDLSEDLNLIISINNVATTKNISNNFVFNTETDWSSIYEISIIYDGKQDNLINKYNDIIHNTMTINDIFL